MGLKFLPLIPSFPTRQSGKVFCSAERSAAIKIRSPDFRQKSSDFVQQTPPDGFEFSFSCFRGLLHIRSQ
jgi:hypothetical protein